MTKSERKNISIFLLNKFFLWGGGNITQEGGGICISNFIYTPAVLPIYVHISKILLCTLDHLPLFPVGWAEVSGLMLI